MQNYVQPGQVLALNPGATVASGEGRLWGAGLFGVAIEPGASGVVSQFLVAGVVDIAKASSLAISVGDVLYWDVSAKKVNKTASGNKAVGVAIVAAGTNDATVRMRLGVAVQPGS